MHVFLILILIFLSISIVAFSLYTGISPMPTSAVIKRALLKALPEDVNTIYELGSGWGGLVFAFAKEKPHARIYGYEISWIPWIISLLILKIKKLKNARIIRKNFYKQTLIEADAVVCYLYPGAMKKLQSQLEQQLRPGAWVVSNSFSLPGWSPIQTIVMNDFWNSKIYIYRKYR